MTILPKVIESPIGTSHTRVEYEILRDLSRNATVRVKDVFKPPRLWCCSWQLCYNVEFCNGGVLSRSELTSWWISVRTWADLTHSSARVLLFPYGLHNAMGVQGDFSQQVERWLPARGHHHLIIARVTAYVPLWEHMQYIYIHIYCICVHACLCAQSRLGTQLSSNNC